MQRPQLSLAETPTRPRQHRLESLGAHRTAKLELDDALRERAGVSRWVRNQLSLGSRRKAVTQPDAQLPQELYCLLLRQAGLIGVFTVSGTDAPGAAVQFPLSGQP